MAISENKFKAFYEIRKYGRNLTDLEIVEIAKIRFGLDLTEKDFEEIRSNYESLLWKYIHKREKN